MHIIWQFILSLKHLFWRGRKDRLSSIVLHLIVKVTLSQDRPPAHHFLCSLGRLRIIFLLLFFFFFLFLDLFIYLVHLKVKGKEPYLL